MTVKWTWRLIAILVAAAAVILLLTFGPAACTSLFTAKQEARVSKGQAGASIEAGAEAMNTVSTVETGAAERRDIVEEGRDEIEKSAPGDSNDAADRAACRLRSYINSERCARLRQAHPE